MEFSYESFVKHAKDFISISNEIGDNWELINYNNKEENVFIKKIVFDKNVLNNNSVLKYEYNIYYNISYGVPVLSFNVWKSNGMLLRLEEVWESSTLRCDSQQDFYSALTQQEHPILQKPYFTIHPCKTAEILNIANKESNPIIRYLSAIGPMVNLFLDNKYGLIKLCNDAEGEG